jgi:peptidoglycan/LPS O-acetylase OafA/YrhL
VFYSIWPSVVILLLLLSIAATPLFSGADSPPVPSKERLSTLDGLRGFLALSVYFHHAAIYYGYMRDGRWRLPPSHIYALLGPVAVSMFFMITGYLFWTKIVQEKGKPDWVKLYVGRIFRIGPIYWSAISVMMFVVLCLTGFKLRVSIIVLFESIIKWLCLGALAERPINDYSSTGVLLAYVTWSLRYEWLFYISLIFIAIFARRKAVSVLFPTLGLFLVLCYVGWCGAKGLPDRDGPFVGLFLFGMSTAAIRFLTPRFPLPNWLSSTLVCVLLAALFYYFEDPYRVGALCLMGFAFFLLANGATIFGILISRPARRLGDVSFGIYLLQGLVLAATFSTQSVRNFAMTSALWYWVIILVAGVILISVATIAHVLIERPGVDLGRALLRQVSDKRRGMEPS